jgi:predicted nucleic-acid-binding protein
VRAVDTNVLVRLITRDDPRHAAAADAFVANGAWVPHLALAEASWVLDSVYGLSAEAIGTAIEMLLSHAQLALQDADAVAEALEQFRRRPSIGFSDCLMLAVSRKAGHGPLGTFDRDLGNVDGAQRL